MFRRLTVFDPLPERLNPVENEAIDLHMGDLACPRQTLKRRRTDSKGRCGIPWPKGKRIYFFFLLTEEMLGIHAGTCFSILCPRQQATDQPFSLIWAFCVSSSNTAEIRAGDGLHDCLKGGMRILPYACHHLDHPCAFSDGGLLGSRSRSGFV